MFQLHDKTRRRITLAAFVSAGVLPLLLTAAWCVNRHLPGCARAEADALGLQLGLVVKLEAVRHLRPGVVLYDGIELADPETGQTILRSRCLEVAWRRRADGQGQLRPTLCVIASQPEVETATIGLTWRWVQRLLERSPGRLEANVQISADAVTLQAGERSQTMTEVAALLESRPSRTTAQLKFRMAGANMPEAGIRIVRNRETSPPTSRFELTTGEGELPCSVLALAIDELKPLGPRCRFYGQFMASETPVGWEGEVVGQLADVDFSRLITDHFPHRLSGIGRATITSARFRRGRLEECCGVVAAEHGTISRSLLEAANQRLGLAAGNAPLPRGHRVAYEELAMSIVLDVNGLRLRGLCRTAELGTILSDGRNRLLGEPPRGSQPIAALVQTLVPQSVVQVPFSRQTDWLLRHLPPADVLAPPGAEDVLPTARAHLPVKWER